MSILIPSTPSSGEMAVVELREFGVTEQHLLEGVGRIGRSMVGKSTCGLSFIIRVLMSKFSGLGLRSEGVAASTEPVVSIEMSSLQAE
jgi:hypothetical protein